jgi:hypothetical protein
MLIDVFAERLRDTHAPPSVDDLGKAIATFGKDESESHSPSAAVIASDQTTVFTSTFNGERASESRLTVVSGNRSSSIALPYHFPHADIGPLSLVPPDIALVGIPDGSGANVGRTLHVIDRSGREAWSVDVPFDILQPPIDGAGRVGLAGGGLAVVEASRVVWSRFVGERVYATAFEDGTLAVARGNEVHVVTRTGVDRQVLAVPAGEIISTPPAIAQNGTVWVATVQALYVARPQ